MLKESDINIIKAGGEIILSSRRARSQQLILLVLIPIVIAFFAFVLSQYLPISVYSLFFLGTLSVGFIVFILSRLHTAKLVNRDLLVKGFLGYETTIPLKDVTASSTFKMQTTAYLKINFIIDGKAKTLWVLKPKPKLLLSDPAFVLEYARSFLKE